MHNFKYFLLTLHLETIKGKMKKKIIISMLIIAAAFSNVYSINKSNHRSKRVKTVHIVKTVKTIKKAKTVKTVKAVKTENKYIIDNDSCTTMRGDTICIDLSKAKPYKPEDGPAL
jgi:hypothetical protein